MIIWETIAIVGLLATALFGAKSVRDFFLSRRMARSLSALASENAAFKDNVDALVKENAELERLKAQLGDELDEFKRDLADLRGVCDLVGELNADSEAKMRAIYARHKALLEAEVRAGALRIVLLLDSQLAAAGTACAAEAAQRKLSVLFPNAPPLAARLTPETLADGAALRALVERLLRADVFGDEARQAGAAPTMCA